MEGAGIPADEPETVNHLVFVVHGIGSWCDLKFRKVTECGQLGSGTAEDAGEDGGMFGLSGIIIASCVDLY